MLFNKHNYPILSDIERARNSNEFSHSISTNGVLSNHKKYEDQTKELIDNALKYHYAHSEILQYSSKVTNILKTSSGFGILDDVDQLNDLNYKDSGIILLSPSATYMYALQSGQDREVEGSMMWINDMDVVSIIQSNKDRSLVIFNESYELGDRRERQNLAESLMNLILELSIFKLYAPIEKKIINKDRKKVKLNSEKHKNELDIDISVIDSCWYTELCRTESFGVSGHFRLQPCGVERKDRRLIWIKAYEKNGYHREAGKVMAGYTIELN